MTAVPHLGFIVAAYALTALVVGGLVAAALLDRRALRRALSRIAWARPRDPANFPFEEEQTFVGQPTNVCLGALEARAGRTEAKP